MDKKASRKAYLKEYRAKRKEDKNNNTLTRINKEVNFKNMNSEEKREYHRKRYRENNPIIKTGKPRL